MGCFMGAGAMSSFPGMGGMGGGMGGRRWWRREQLVSPRMRHPTPIEWVFEGGWPRSAVCIGLKRARLRLSSDERSVPNRRA